MCHGIISSLSVLYMIDLLYQQEKWDQRDFENDVVPACAAIFVHNLPTRCFESAKLDQNRAALPYLLRLSDCLQDWERPSAENHEGLSDSGFDIDAQDGRLIFKVAYPNRRHKIMKEIESVISDPNNNIEITV